MKEINQRIFSHKLFRVSVIIKGLNGIFDIIIGILTFLASRYFLDNITAILFKHELAQDPSDFLANFTIKSFAKISLLGKTFLAAYFIIHGLINLILFLSLWYESKKGFLTAFPIIILFTLYQIYKFFFIKSAILFILILFDIFIFALMINEYKNLSGKNQSRETL